MGLSHQSNVPTLVNGSVGAPLRHISPEGSSDTGDAVQTVKALHCLLANAGSNLLPLQISGNYYWVGTEPLGMGDRGIVYELHDCDRVLKLPRPDPRSILTLSRERQNILFWRSQSRGRGFAIPQPYDFSADGLYSISEKIKGETLSAYLLRTGVFAVNGDGLSVTQLINSRTAGQHAPNLGFVFAALMQMKRICEAYPQHAVSLSPNNIMVSYADEAMTRITAVTLVDYGPTTSWMRKYAHVCRLQEYLGVAQNRLQKYLRKGYI